ncbi:MULTISPECIES: hypothetical protein [unclassified Streptomyces]|uniref:hypothetical protein n=1 Tax=unclassified Streptomyces TaxID=2593676 RepID=UPI0004CB1310|nr:hypothetical protein [Streptomyces sp. NRRL F-2747]
MRTRDLTFGLYADEEGLAWVGALVEDVVGSRSARIVGTATTATPMSGADDFLARQWAVEHSGRASGARRSVTLRLRVVCSLRTRRALRKALIAALCPEGAAPHTCLVPWSAY